MRPEEVDRAIPAHWPAEARLRVAEILRGSADDAVSRMVAQAIRVGWEMRGAYEARKEDEA